MAKKILQTNGEMYRKYWTRGNLYIKSRLQNEILYTASIVQEIEADGNKKKGDREEAANANEETRGKARGEEGRS